MKKLLNKFKVFFSYILGFFPSSLPVGMTAYHKWSDSIISTYQPPANPRDIKWALANMIMHLDSTTDKKPKRFFAKALHKAAANQIAAGVVMELKAQQEAERKLQQELAAATAAQEAADAANETRQ